jgi:uncharacterized protein (TIGR00297 family)
LNLWRAVAGFFLAMAIASGARAAHALSPSGVFAATLIGTLAIAAGFNWGILLIAYFVVTPLLSKWGEDEKERRTGAVVAKGGARDAMQVLANGAVFALAAAAFIVDPSDRWVALGAGGLAVSASDTFATEIGTLLGASPRSVLTWRAVPAGTSGGVSAAGTVAALLGAAIIGWIVILLGFPRATGVSVAVGGLAGSTLDSLVGATLQARRWCPRCDTVTERTVHVCGAETERRGGIPFLDNDLVNLLSSVIGGLLAVLLAV